MPKIVEITKSSAIIEETRETYDNPDFEGVVRVTKKVTSSTTNQFGETNAGSFTHRYVEHNGNIKGLVLALARYGTLMELPYTIAHTDNEYYYALTDDNFPQKVKFSLGKEAYPKFRELIMPIDFNGDFDEDLVRSIREKYKVSNTLNNPILSIDPEDIETNQEE